MPRHRLLRRRLPDAPASAAAVVRRRCPRAAHYAVSHRVRRGRRVPRRPGNVSLRQRRDARLRARRPPLVRPHRRRRCHGATRKQLMPAYATLFQRYVRTVYAIDKAAVLPDAFASSRDALPMLTVMPRTWQMASRDDDFARCPRLITSLRLFVVAPQVRSEAKCGGAKKERRQQAPTRLLLRRVLMQNASARRRR